MRSYVTLLVILMVLLLVLPVSAKNDAYVEDPSAEWAGIDTPLALPAPLEWKELHGRLGVNGDVDAFSFTFDEAFEDWTIEMRVPVCGEHFAPVYPSLAVIGAGLEAPEAEALPFVLPEGQGAIILNSERSEPRVQDSQYYFMYEAAGENFTTHYYLPTTTVVDIPQAGDYTVAVWEPDGHVGAYFVWTGNEHPEDIGAYRNIGELERVFTAIGNGSWMGQDCAAPLVSENCPLALTLTGRFPEHDFPARNRVGQGFVLTGTVYEAGTCLPIAGAEVRYEMANADGEYDGIGTGTVYTNQQGSYRIESFLPGRYGANTPPHIHLYISAEGYEGAATEHILSDGETTGQTDVSLRSKA
ncbi:MAG: hypothetical protein L0154_20455 [Chloroflexi bacterium]|nr:hypothetical protein [Chloroflexota bacterium]